MTRRLMFGYLALTFLGLLVLMVPLGYLYGQRERERAASDLEHDATVMVPIYEERLESGGPVNPAPAEQYHARTGGDVVIVDRDGVSVVDTDQPIGRDLSGRPELAQALLGAVVTGTGDGARHVAVPVASGGEIYGALRVARDVAGVEARIGRFRWALAVLGAVILAAVALFGWAIARSVTRPIRQLNAAAARFAAGDLAAGPRSVSGPPEVRDLAATMAAMADQLDALLRTQRAFVADASHQLRTPLTALRLRLENLQAAVPGPPAAELEAAIDETSRLAALVADLLQLARADDRPGAGVADLAQLAVDRVDTWTAVAETAGVTLVADVAAGEVLVRADPGAVEQILDNVLDNAVHASPVGATVTVRVSCTATTHDLTISDQGRGLTDEQKLLATHRFWRARADTTGTGLGLSIVESLAGAAGAGLRLADAPGGGLAVTVSFRPAGSARSARSLTSATSSASPASPASPAAPA